MSCTKSYGKSIIELLIQHNILQEDLEGRRLITIQLKLIPVFHSTMFHSTDSRQPAVRLVFIKHCFEHVHAEYSYYERSRVKCNLRGRAGPWGVEIGGQKS